MIIVLAHSVTEGIQQDNTCKVSGKMPAHNYIINYIFIYSFIH